jgi:two-component system LytT family sensor kinase
MPGIRKKHLLEILLHLLFWVGIFYVEQSFTSLNQFIRRNFNGQLEESIILKSAYPISIITLGLLMTLFYTNAFWLLKTIVGYKNKNGRIAIIVGWTAFVIAANYILGLLFIRFTNINVHEWQRFQFNISLIFLFVLGLSTAYFFSKEWIKNELLRKQLEAYQLTTEIKFLKSQINPHFLFNTLNNLFSMAQEKGNDELADGISKLSGMMRYMIYESNAETVPLKNEIEYIKSSIALNKLRYADNEALVNFHYGNQIPDIFIAPMLFIPFIENAFKHGVLINNTSPIDISIAVNDKVLLFTCENKNYSFVKKMENDKSGIGLENVKRRLELVYPARHELMIKSDEDQFRVELKIDLS